MGYGLEYQQPFFEDPTGAGDLLDEDEDEDEDDGWNGAYLPSTVEQTCSSGVATSTSPCSTYVSFFSTPSELVGPETLPPWTLSNSDSHTSPAGSPSADFVAHGESLGDRHLRTLQISYEAVSETTLHLCLASTSCLSRQPGASKWPWGHGVLAPGTRWSSRVPCGSPLSWRIPYVVCHQKSRVRGSEVQTLSGPSRGHPSGKGPLQASAQRHLAVF